MAINLVSPVIPKVINLAYTRGNFLQFLPLTYFDDQLLYCCTSVGNMLDCAGLSIITIIINSSRLLNR